MSTQFLFRDQPYLRELEAEVTTIDHDGAIELDRTIFYAQSGGQPGDSGVLRAASGQSVNIGNTIHPGDKNRIAHLPSGENENDWRPQIGDKIVCEIDWERRHKLMRMHTAMHLLSVLFPFPVTGGSIGQEKGRLDFDMPEVPENLEQVEADLNRLIEENHTVSGEWISEEELAANPEMVKTMKVKPPMGQGRVRLIRIASGDTLIDLQPCGGTHVATTGEIGAVVLGKIQKKGKQNRRVNLLFA
ncbi:Ser-tRNA(Ala) deacylase @ Gly-tRNA(Ala) deacylase [hydrothermal vent metagenome]|uniref:Ser-tRNA(Ala) deacylase @ Gly-tRNA(Ala) deacylase n=1 Tax=hydrothermal vent metagenome TaxID=652676 RepID=A0A3B0TVL1_9ZZZZ